MSSISGVTAEGYATYWAVTAIMAASTITFVGFSFTTPRRKRIFHYITAGITLVSSIAYFAMACNLGYTAVEVEYMEHPREVFYVRYIDWFVTTPLLLVGLLLTAGLPWPIIILTIFLDWVMVVTGLVGALVTNSYKWAFFGFATVALIFIAWNVIFVGGRRAAAVDPHVSKIFRICGAWTIFLRFIYQIAWGLCEGSYAMSSDSEAVFYAVLDVLAKPVFGALLLIGQRNIDPATLGLHILDEDDDINEKNTAADSSATPGYDRGGNIVGTSRVTGAGPAFPVLHMMPGSIGVVAAPNAQTAV